VSRDASKYSGGQDKLEEYLNNGYRLGATF